MPKDSFLDTFCGLEAAKLAHMEAARVNAMVKGLTDLVLLHNDQLFEDYFTEAMTIQQALAVRYNSLRPRPSPHSKPVPLVMPAEAYRDYLRRRYVGQTLSRCPSVK